MFKFVLKNVDLGSGQFIYYSDCFCVIFYFNISILKGGYVVLKRTCAVYMQSKPKQLVGGNFPPAPSSLSLTPHPPPPSCFTSEN